MLIDWGCRIADDKKLKSYVEASPQGTPLYARFGFKAQDTPVLDLGEGVEPTSYTFMERAPVASSS